MSLTIRNLVIFALFCVLISSVSISRIAHNHRQAAQPQPQPANNVNTFLTNAQNTAASISSSIQPTVPSIFETRNLPTFTFTRNTCDTLNAQQKTQTLDKVKQTKDSIQTFKKNVQNPQVLANATNAFSYLTTI